MSAAVALAAVTAAAVPALSSSAAPSAVRPVAGAPATTTVTVDGITATCSTPGRQYSVNANNISIRATPGGAVVAGISEGRFFNSAWEFNSQNTNCTATVGGQLWVYGYPNYNPGVVGWVLAEFLDPIGTF
jgi:hypothetical protein